MASVTVNCNENVNKKVKHWSENRPEVVIDWSQIPGGSPDEWQGTRRLDLRLRWLDKQDQGNRIDELRESRKRISALIKELKNNPCTDCGKQYHPAAMDFDHVEEGHKVFCIAEYKAFTEAEVLQELQKCQLVCSNCHRVRTANRRSKKDQQ